jgi:hypothetical protein
VDFGALGFTIFVSFETNSKDEISENMIFFIFFFFQKKKKKKTLVGYKLVIHTFNVLNEIK